MSLLIAIVLAVLPAAVILSFPIHAAWLFRRSRQRACGCEPPLRTSVIIPLRGAEENTAANIGALLSQRAASAMEFIFCVEDESDPVVPIVRTAIESSAKKAGSIGGERHARVVATGPADGLGKMHNLLGGIAEATGDLLVFVDGDVLLDDPRYLENFAAELGRPGVGLVSCFPAYRGARNAPAAATAMTINNDLLGYFAILGAWGRLSVANGSCMAMTRDTLDGLGGLEEFRSQLLMDTALAKRIAGMDRRVHLHHRPAPVVRRDMSWQECWEQSHRWQVSMWRVLPRWKYLLFAWFRSATALTAVAAVATSFDPVVLASLGIVALSRIASAFTLNLCFVKNRSFGRFVWILPAVEVINCVSSIGAILIPRVTWRGDRYRVLVGGTAVRVNERGGER